ncbi:sterol desaturase family protein [Alkalimarinus sediminis]|uniref:Sterol desaturase family protein n=1 Tax=Alkalimarinus sediminis TaxID=1632866 RepID=A0A9E8HL54_9ALTE|nr:sterol desaturase family protein [Alkalimarinus sediminis]UZW75342.1 sterol desaturase family protein [Alkalimarinus sediminis]
MVDHYVAFSIPVFLLLIAFEAIYFWRRHHEKFRINDTMTNLSCGIVTLIFEVFTKGGLFLFFNYISKNFGVAEWDMNSASTWIIFFFIYDFFYYWGHRLSHSINFMWSGHLPHHQSEEYNLSVALRQGAFQDTVNFPVFLPMAIMGCPIEVFATVLLLNKFFQLWVHTRSIGRVPLIEGILNTPSAHRVHHAVNPIYVDRNHGGVIMLWDKLFGTWADEREEEPCIFGVRKPYRSWNPLYAHIEWWSRLWKDAVQTKRWRDKVKLWFMPTGWRPADVTASNPWEPYDIDRYQKYDPKVSTGRKVLSIVLFMLTLPMISHLLLEQFNLPLLDKVIISGGILVCLYTCGLLLGGGKYARQSEAKIGTVEPR